MNGGKPTPENFIEGHIRAHVLGVGLGLISFCFSSPFLSLLYLTARTSSALQSERGLWVLRP